MGAVSGGFVHLVVWLSASAFMIALDVLLNDSPRIARIVELNGLAFYSQLPWQLALVAVALTFEPPTLAVQPDGLTADDFERFKRLLEQDQVLAAVRAVNHCLAAWLYGLFGAGYHALAGASLPWSLALSVGMFGVFHLLPAAR
jgi:hypothetical protein